MWDWAKQACARFGWTPSSAIRAPQRACHTASGSGECARSRTPVVSGWRSSAAPAFRAFGGWRARVETIWAFVRAAATSHGRRDQSRGVHCPSKEAPPVVGRRRCGVRAATFFSRAQLAPTSERGWGASLNLTRFISLDARGRCGADGAEYERQRCRGRAARPRVRWFAFLPRS